MRALPPVALTYHGVADVRLRCDPHRLFVRPQDLLRDIEALRRWGYELLTFGEWAKRVVATAGQNAAALTFDDGWVDNLETLAPLLERHAVPATVFAVSGALGKPHPAAPWTRYLAAGELRELRRRGVEIGGHTRTHPDLTKLSRNAVFEELAGGKAELERLLGEEVTVAAYPFGLALPETIEACRRAGFSAAARSSALGDWRDPLNLPRQDMQNRSTLTGLRLKIHDLYEPLVAHRWVRASQRVSLALRGAPLRKPPVDEGATG